MDNSLPFGELGSYQDVARNETVAVTTSSSIISDKRNDANPRKVILIRNVSLAVADIITVNLGAQQAVANTGIILKQGESFIDSTDSGYTCFQGSLTAICATANGQLSIMER